jgi:hypothetical protein
MSPSRLTILLTCSLALSLVTACAPPQSLTDQEKSASIERLQQLKNELAALQAELAETRAREQQAENVPVVAPPQPRPRPAWISWTGDPLPTGYGSHATLLAGKQPNPDAAIKFMALLESLPTEPVTPVNEQTLFIIPTLNKTNRGYSLENYDQQTAEELLEKWPDSVADAGPYLLVEPSDTTSDFAGRLLINLNGLSDTERRNLLLKLQRPFANDATELLTALIRERQGIPASVTSFGDDFRLEWPR